MTRTAFRTLMLFCLLVAAMAMASWPALWNGFPIVYDDNSVYLAYPDTMLAAMPQLYAMFLWSMAQIASLPAAIVVQSFIAVYVVWSGFAVFTSLAPAGRLVATIILCALTQLSWLVSQITPDFMGGIGVLAVLILAFKPRRSSEDIFLFLVTVAAGLVSTANILVILPLAIGLALARTHVTGHRFGWGTGIGLALLFVAAIVPQYIFNATVVNKPTLAIGSSARLFSKLTDHGLARPYLDRACKKGDAPACWVAFEIRDYTEHEQFLWGLEGDEESPAEKFGAWNDYTRLFARWSDAIILAYPAQALGAAMGDAALLATRLTLSLDGRDHISHAHRENGVRYRIETHHIFEMPAFMAAKQQRDMLASGFPTTFYVIMTLASYAGLLAGLIVGIRHRDAQLIALCGSILAALIWSTLVHGGLSAPIPRYTVKCSWLAMFATLAWLARVAETWRKQAA